MTAQPTRKFQKNQDLEALSSELNAFLKTFGKNRSQAKIPELPPVFIVGAPRSGTTLVYQTLASTQAFAFPSNLMSRFYGSLRFASLVHKVVVDRRFDFHGEFSDVVSEVGFDSRLGKTKGLAQPNEFWYFWRRFFPVSVPVKLTKSEMENADIENFVSEIAEMEEVFGRPVLMKAMLLCFNLQFVQSKMERVIFLYVKRDPISNARSLLKAREDYYGNLHEWYSARPGAYPELKDRTPFEQVIGQVLLTNREIEQQLAALPGETSIEVEYEAFCSNPGKVLDSVRSRYAALGFELDQFVVPDQPFSCRNQSAGQNWEKELSDAELSLRNLGLV